MAQDADAALAAAQALVGGVEAPEEVTPVESGEPAAATPAEETGFTWPTFEPEIPEDLAEELDEPDLSPTGDEDDDLSEYDPNDPLVLRLRAAEKKANYEAEQRVKSARKEWKKEAEKFFPLSAPFLDDTHATSRRAFLREAKAAHDLVLPLVNTQVIEPFKAALEAERETIRTEERAAAAAAWGKPATDGTPVPADVTATNEAIKTAREKNDLVGAIRAMMGAK